VLAKDVSSGPFVEEWKKVYSEISKDVEEVDVSTAISSAAFAVKDENELVSRSGHMFLPSNLLTEH
jgi:nucleosome binding factor SPN SPT16 subunit